MLSLGGGGVLVMLFMHDFLGAVAVFFGEDIVFLGETIVFL